MSQTPGIAFHGLDSLKEQMDDVVTGLAQLFADYPANPDLVETIANHLRRVESPRQHVVPTNLLRAFATGATAMLRRLGH
ncbi:MAG: hypothetical protein KKE37_12155 [Verrucomicrobia bacterium]|nr:hypothetical protein [Verrucomicrobiota bacterium]MBU4289657.1 hypothetical protein [Verrucomicrobiota bacterium]MBU4430089.1 hypothetical protein [Verrucomicrobiota bacterium]MCG2681355.1 hypothetical protein [Kiritimatiellia bacterium]